MSNDIFTLALSWLGLGVAASAYFAYRARLSSQEANKINGRFLAIEEARLAELRQQAQAKGLYGTVWSCVTNERIKLDSWPGEETLEDEVQA